MNSTNPVDVVYHLRVSLRGISPPIWRRLRVPATCSIADLHDILQTAMGWEDEHLHRFCIRGWHYGVSRDGAAQWFTGPSSLTLAEFSFREYERFTYEYNFYACWLHDIRVEKILAADSLVALPDCISGARACPQEDMPDATHFMDARDEHRPVALLCRVDELIEADDIPQWRAEIHDWPYWLHRDQFDRAKVNTALQALALSCRRVPDQENIHANYRQAAHRQRGDQPLC